MPINPVAGPPGRPGPGRDFRSHAAISTLPTISAISPNSSRLAGGATATITGTNFRLLPGGSAPTVIIGGVAATGVVVIDSTTITCVIPIATAAALVDVTVAVGSQSATLAGSFTYYTGVITAITPSHGTFAGGTSVIISGFNFVSGSTITFDGTPATGVTFVDDENFICVTPNHATGFVDVVITEPSSATVTLPDGFQYTLLTRGDDIRRKPGVTIRDVLNNTPNTCTFTVDGKSNAPVVGEEIRIVDAQDGNRLLFAGNVQVVDQEYDGIPGPPGGLNWKATAVDFTWLLNKLCPIGDYVNVSASDIVKDLVTRFAPGFTSNHVQTSLAPINISFNGSEDFATCLTRVATAIGGGHWYVDYDRDVHFFHVVPPGITIPNQPQTILHLGPGSAMTVSNGSPLPSTDSYSAGYFSFRTTFIYDNGAESAYGPISNLAILSGHNYIHFANIPIGANVGTHTCVKRRIHELFAWGDSRWTPHVDVNDNVTTSIDVGVTSSPPTFSIISSNTSHPRPRYVPPPPGPTTAPSVSGSSAPLVWLPSEIPGQTHLPTSKSPGTYFFKVAFLYRDGTVSLPGPSSAGVYLDNTHGIQFSNLPIGPSISGVDVVARIIYASHGGSDFNPATSWPFHAVTDNSSTSYAYDGGQPMRAFPMPRPYQSGTGTPVWPNPDGPSLENADPPDPLTIDNRLTLNDPQLTVSTDLSQVRNRVYVRGAGSTLIWSSDEAQATADAIIAAAQLAGTTPVLPNAALAGDALLYVNDIAAFTPFGGTIVAGGLLLKFDGVTGVTGNGAIYLSAETPLSADLPYGASIVNILQVDDLESQHNLAAVELDVNGNPTDGVHEYTVSDSSLTTYFQMYMRAYAELELFGRPVVTLKYSTRDPKTRSGAIVHADLKYPPCHGDFLIQDVTIDQIHDEADVLMPRYNVTASSVKFNLNDLLMQLVSGTLSSAGTAPTTGQVSSTATPVAVIPIPTSGRRAVWADIEQGNLTNVGCTLITSAGTYTFVTDALAWWQRDTISGSNPGGWATNSANNTWIQWLPKLIFRIRTGPDVTDVRYWIGWGGNIGPDNSDIFQSSGAPRKFIGVRFSTAAPDSGWTPIHCQGDGVLGTTHQTLYPSLARVTPNTIYTITITVISLTQWQVDINGAASALLTIHPDLLSTQFGPLAKMCAAAGVATRIFDFSSFYFERNG